MKIAVLLRGKQNFSKTGSALFETFMRKKFSHVDFKFFIHTWESLPIFPGSKNSLKQGIHLQSLVQQKISYWKPAVYEIGKEIELLNIIKKILQKQSHDDSYHTWVQDQKKNTKNYELVSPFFIDKTLKNAIKNIDQIIENPDINNINHKYILRTIFSGFYLTGQMYSAMKAFNLYKSYNQENNYVPDFFICTRSDTVFNLNTRFFLKIKNVLNKVCRLNTANILCSEVKTVRGQGWVQDYAFITDAQGAESFLGGNPERRLIDLAFNHRVRTTGLLDSRGMQPHVLWPILGHKCNFLEASFFLSTLVRREFSSHDLINLDQKKIFEKISDELLDWFVLNMSDHQLSDKTLFEEIRRIQG